MKKKLLCALALTGVMSVSAMAAPKVAVDYNVIDGSDIVEQNGISYFPVRAVAEAMGLTVEWKAEDKSVVVTNGGPVYITFKIGENAYTFAKTAPMELSGAPVIIDEKTYIPTDVITDLFAFEVIESDETYNIITKYQENTEVQESSADESQSDKGFADLEEKAAASGVVTDVNDEQIIFEDAERGTVILTKSDTVKVTDKNGNEADINSITTDMKITVEYGPAMTMSIPPINNPVSITIE